MPSFKSFNLGPRAILLAAALAVGIGAAIISNKPDGKLEEASEYFVETETAKSLGLSPEALRGTIDFSQGSPEPVKD